MYEHSRNCRQSWDGRVYHRPSLLGTISRRHLRHSHTESVEKHTTARCYGCWLQRSQPVMRGCSPDSVEELELVSLLQVLLVCLLPAICPALSTYMRPVPCKIAHVTAHTLIQQLRCVQSIYCSMHTAHQRLLMLVMLMSIL